MKKIIQSAGRSAERNIQKLALTFIKERTEKSFNFLVARIYWGLWSYVYKIIPENTAVEDIISKTLENIYFKCDQFDPKKANFSTWMYKIAYNNTLKYLQEKNKVKNSSYSEDYENIYDSELGKETVVSDEDADVITITDDLVDIVFTSMGKNVEVYKRERVYTEIYDASVECINFLPNNLQMVMRERFINNKKIEDIAIDNNVPVSSVKNWLRKGKDVLRDTIQERYADLYNMYTDSEN